MLPIKRKLQGKIIHSQTQKAVANVYKFMKRATDAGVPTNLKKTKKKSQRPHKYRRWLLEE
jgi:hypothetical protein